MAAWDKREDETQKAYEAFCVYRDFGKTRSIDSAYRHITGQRAGNRRATGLFTRWAAEHEWKTRAEAYDGHLELEARKQREADHLKELSDYRDRQRKLAAATIEASIALLQKSNSRLKSLSAEEITPAVLPQFFRAAAAVAESATNSEANALAVEELLKALNGSSDD